VQKFFLCVYFYSLHVSGSHVPIIGRIVSMRHLVFISFSCFIPTCVPDGHLHRVTYTRCRTDTNNSPDDGQMDARNT